MIKVRHYIKPNKQLPGMNKKNLLNIFKHILLKRLMDLDIHMMILKKILVVISLQKR